MHENTNKFAISDHSYINLFMICELLIKLNKYFSNFNITKRQVGRSKEFVNRFISQR